VSILHKAYTEALSQVKSRLSTTNCGHCFRLTLEAFGRVDASENDISIEYTLSINHGDVSVTGDSVDSCLEEAMRRMGWKERHKPLRLA